jgi:hypothetical protein
MNRKIYWLAIEPTQIAYRNLLAAAGSRAAKLTLVVRKEIEFAPSCSEFLETLKDHLVEVREQSQWPGTQLLGGSAKVYWYAISPQIIHLIEPATRSLYGWRSPNLPEDIAFYRDDGSVLLGSCSHEKFGFLELDDEELRIIQIEIAGVELEWREHQSPKER